MPKEKTILPSQEKLPPHSIEAEEHVIGSIVLQPINAQLYIDQDEPGERNAREVYDAVSSIITEDDFFDHLNQIVFKAFGQVNDINAVTITNWITQAQEWSNYGNKIQAHLLHCSSLSPTNRDAEHYAKEIKRLSLLRKLIDISQYLATDAFNGRRQILDIVNSSINQLEKIARDSLSVNKRVIITNFKVLTSSQRAYEMTVNGNYIKCDVSTLLSRKDFKALLLNKLDFIPILPPAEDWDKYVNSLLDKATKEETPIETSSEYELKEDIQEWLDRIPLAEQYKDLKPGAYVVKSIEGKDYILFQITPLLKALKSKKYVITISKLWASMKSWGVLKHETRVGDTPCKLWALPNNFIEENKTPEIKSEYFPEWF